MVSAQMTFLADRATVDARRTNVRGQLSDSSTCAIVSGKLGKLQ